jgi:hypothetical protein
MPLSSPLPSSRRVRGTRKIRIGIEGVDPAGSKIPLASTLP